jgi:hypothetical protein
MGHPAQGLKPRPFKTAARSEIPLKVHGAGLDQGLGFGDEIGDGG